MKKTDARIINSKKYLKEALLSLLSEMKISDIKVVTLCRRAEINRATFYSHYNNVYELFDETINEFIILASVFFIHPPPTVIQLYQFNLFFQQN